jgi:peptidoglycan biosynthesis protein MviN/MurJ (putative lipid II flippase)
MEAEASVSQVEAVGNTIGGGQFRATIRLSIFSGLNILLGTAVQLLVAYHFGAGDELDAYLVAFTLPSVLQATLVFAINSVLIPLYLKTGEGDEMASQSDLLNTSLTALLVLLLVLLMCRPIFTMPILKIVMKGLPARTLELAVQLSPMPWLVMVGNVLFGLFSSVLQANRAYTLQGVAPLFASIVTLACVWVVSLNSRDGIGQQLKAVAFSVEPETLNGGARNGLGGALLPQSSLSMLWNTLLRRANGQERFQFWPKTRAVQSLWG